MRKEEESAGASFCLRLEQNLMIDQIHTLDPAVHDFLVTKDADQTPNAVFLGFHNIHEFHEQMFPPVF
jgi:hypothetical protein